MDLFVIIISSKQNDYGFFPPCHTYLNLSDVTTLALPGKTVSILNEEAVWVLTRVTSPMVKISSSLDDLFQSCDEKKIVT